MNQLLMLATKKATENFGLELLKSGAKAFVIAVGSVTGTCAAKKLFGDKAGNNNRKAA